MCLYSRTVGSFVSVCFFINTAVTVNQSLGFHTGMVTACVCSSVCQRGKSFVFVAQWQAGGGGGECHLAYLYQMQS